MKKTSMIVAILIMAIGFAAISTTLIIQGSSKIKENEYDFEIIFTESILDTVDVYNDVISEDKKTITFTSNELKKLNDTSVLNYEVTNNSNNYDAEVTINCGVKSGTTAEYTSITNSLEDNKTIISAKESVNGTLTITLDKVSVEEVTEEYTCTLEFNAVERETLGVSVPYTESILNGTDPILSEKLIPVTISDNGSVTYADIRDKWYSYAEKTWANAVILEDNKSYNVGDTIKEEDIESYFVWIPRYKYKLFNVSNTTLDSKTYTNYLSIPSKVQTIEIVFENKNTTPSNGSTNNTWLTHPAFTSFDSNGFWVGKFETGYRGATSASAANVNSTDKDKVIIKPNTYSWRNITVGNMFLTSYEYMRDNDSHMMKNTEWGAVAYLSHSTYGINDERRINNNSSFLTGYAAINAPTCGYTSTNETCNKYGNSSDITAPYNTSTGYLATTTGNITGVYDMSGGAHEYVAAYMSGQLGSSGLTPSNYNSKYFDVYSSSSTITSYNYRILGDATGEMGPFTTLKSSGSAGDKTSYVSSWYGDSSHFVDSSYPWFHRGGSCYYGVLAGQFRFNRNTGGVHANIGFRLVLV